MTHLCTTIYSECFKNKQRIEVIDFKRTKDDPWTDEFLFRMMAEKFVP